VFTAEVVAFSNGYAVRWQHCESGFLEIMFDVFSQFINPPVDVQVTIVPAGITIEIY